MRLWSSLCGLGFCAAVLFNASAAHAQEPDPNEQTYPVVYAQRPITLSQMTLHLNGGMDVTRLVKAQIAGMMPLRDLETRINVNAGAAFGITRNLEVFASLATLQVKPKVDYGNPSLGMMYRFLNSGLEAAFRADVILVTKPDTLLSIDKIGGILEPSVPFLFHFGKTARLDFGAGLPVTIQKGKPVMFGLDAPLAFAFNLVDALHLGLKTSVYMNDFKDISRSFTIPLGVFAGLSFGSEKPFLEVDPFFTWPQFAQPLAKKSVEDPLAQKVNVDIFTAGATARFFIFL